MENRTYNINGITCEACATLIKMEFDDNGISDVEVNIEEKTLLIPKTSNQSIDEINSILSNAGNYSLAVSHPNSN